jgi:hypothetical protein
MNKLDNFDRFEIDLFLHPYPQAKWEYVKNDIFHLFEIAVLKLAILVMKEAREKWDFKEFPVPNNEILTKIATLLLLTQDSVTMELLAEKYCTTTSVSFIKRTHEKRFPELYCFHYNNIRKIGAIVAEKILNTYIYSANYTVDKFIEILEHRYLSTINGNHFTMKRLKAYSKIREKYYKIHDWDEDDYDKLLSWMINRSKHVDQICGSLILHVLIRRLFKPSILVGIFARDVEMEVTLLDVKENSHDYIELLEKHGYHDLARYTLKYFQTNFLAYGYHKSMYCEAAKYDFIRISDNKSPYNYHAATIMTLMQGLLKCEVEYRLIINNKLKKMIAKIN